MTGPTTVLLLVGLAAGQPGPGVRPDDVKRVAVRVQRLDPGGPATGPFSPQDIEAIKKLLDANPALKQEVERRVKEFQQLPPEGQATKLADMKAAADNPALKEQIRRTAAELANKPAGGGGPKSATPRPKQSRPQPAPPQPKDGAPTPKDGQEPQPAAPDPSAPTPPPVGQQAPSAATPGTALPPAGDGRGFEKFASFWEKNVGPLKDMPAVQQLAKELFRGAAAAPADGDAGPLGGLIDAKTASGLLNGLPEVGKGGDWQLPDLGGADDLGRPSLPRASFSTPDMPSAGGAGLVAGVLTGVGLLVAILVLLPRLKAPGGDPQPVPGLGPWPLDPRTVATRADLVRAFEYLSVLVNGTPARTYSHESAAAAFREAVPAAADSAEPLAHAYALARYTRADDPYTSDQIADARRHLCRLAGVPAP